MIDALESYNDVDNYTASTEEASYTNVVAEDAEGNILEDQNISYTRYIGYSDHFPVVAKFTYTGTVPLN
jgi:hypothetical protein